MPRQFLCLVSSSGLPSNGEWQLNSLWRFTSPYMVWSPVTLGPHHWLFSALFSCSVLLPVPRMDTLAHCRFKATSLWLPPSPLLALSSVPFHQDILCSLYFRLHLSLNKYLSTPYPPSHLVNEGFLVPGQ